MSLWTRDRDKTDRGERGNRRKGGGHMECRSVAQLPPDLCGNMTPNSKAGRRGMGAPFWLKQA